MLIKAADDRRGDIEQLEALLARPALDPSVRERINTELKRVASGRKAEREAAYEIEFHFRDNPNRITIHDLRLEVDGRVAQIDHLIIDRMLQLWVCESKHFAEGVAVDEFGEWVGFRGNRPYGIGSPIEQNRKHIKVLRTVFDKGLVELPKRLGFAVKPDFRGLVLVSKNARISRPKAKATRDGIDGLDSVIKLDQLFVTIDKVWDSKGLTDARRIVGKGEIERVARGLAALHRPAPIDWGARFGLVEEAATEPSAPASATPTCQSCGRSVSARVVQYCLDQAVRFGGRILCYDCQRRAPIGAA